MSKLKECEKKPVITKAELLKRMHYLRDIEECLFDTYPKEFRKVRNAISEEIVEISMEIGRISKFEEEWEEMQSKRDMQKD